MLITIDWMEKFSNSPVFVISDIRKPNWPLMRARAWEKREHLHRSEDAPFVHYFYTDGNPTHGFGGASFTGTFTDGTPFAYHGAWSSRAACVNSLWPESPIVDVSLREHYLATAMLASEIINWRKEHTDCDWGLVWVDTGDSAPTLQPTRNGDIKRASFREMKIVKVEV